MLNVEQLKRSVNRMELDDIRQAVDELQMDGLVTDGKTPFTRVHFNTCFAEIEGAVPARRLPPAARCGRLPGRDLCVVRPLSLGGRGSAALVEGIPRGIASPDSGVSATPASAQLVCQARAGHPHDQHHQRTEGPHGDPRKAPGLFRSEQAGRIHRNRPAGNRRTAPGPAGPGGATNRRGGAIPPAGRHTTGNRPAPPSP